nr:hypothetical protein [Tanacetum cinerariifolium]
MVTNVGMQSQRAITIVKPSLLPTPPTTINPSGKPLAIKWISPAKRQERLSKGLCFNCDNKWVRGHKCPVRGHKCLDKFLLVMVDDDLDADTVVDGEAMEGEDISILNYLIKHGSLRSLRLWGTICTGQLHILIDNGSTHNFLQQEVLEKMKLPITTMKQFKVYIGSGETLVCENLCSHVKLDIQGLSMEVDLYVLSMKGSNIVLGIQWLQKLGKVTHDYLQQTMEFILGETRYTLQGDESLCIKRIILHHMRALLDTDEVYGVYELYNLASPRDEQEHAQLDMSSEHPEITPLLRCCFKYRLPFHHIGFKWGELDNKAFEDLKTRLLEVPILGLPNFKEVFVVETDSSDVAATYQKDLFAIVEAVYKWRQYLLWHRFIIRTDHMSLKELMQQVILTPLQSKYVRKLMGFDFAIEYKPQNQTAAERIKMTPYQVVYGRAPPLIIPYLLESSKVAVVEELLIELEVLLRQLKQNLAHIKNQMEMQVNMKRCDVEFNSGDMVLVKLQPYRLITLAKCSYKKLAKSLPCGDDSDGLVNAGDVEVVKTLQEALQTRRQST